jgi:SAM-dependent methyltransferase
MTGMPSASSLPGMMVELFLYGLASGLFYRIIKTKNLYLDIYLTLLIAMLLGRIAGGLTNWGIYLTAVAGNPDTKAYTWASFWGGYFVLTWPGLVIQVILIPAILIALSKTHLISSRDRELFPERAMKRNAEQEAAYFNALAQTWDEHRGLTEERIAALLAPCAIQSEERVLDLACGTGIIDPELAKEGATVLGVDVSPEMIEIAIKKNTSPHVHYESADFYSFVGGAPFDKIIVFDAYPHFLDKEAFGEKAASLLKSHGHLYIIHAAGKDEINAHHAEGENNSLATPLKSPEKESQALWKEFTLVKGEDEKDHYFLDLEKKR